MLPHFAASLFLSCLRGSELVRGFFCLRFDFLSCLRGSERASGLYPL